MTRTAPVASQRLFFTHSRRHTHATAGVRARAKAHLKVTSRYGAHLAPFAVAAD